MAARAARGRTISLPPTPTPGDANRPPRTPYGGLKVEQTRRFKEIERENVRLRRAVADLTLDKLILKEVAEGNV